MCNEHLDKLRSPDKLTSSYPGWIKSPHHTDLPKFQFGGGGLGGWGLGGYSETEKSKCQDLPKFQFSGEGGLGDGGVF